MRKIFLLLCVLSVLSSCQSAQEAQQQLQQQAEEQAKQQVQQGVDKAKDEANKAKDSFLGNIGQTIAGWGKAIQDWWNHIWGSQPVKPPVDPSKPEPDYPAIYVINTNGALGRPCANRSKDCSVNLKKFNRGDKITVTGTTQGESVNGNSEWLIVSYNNSDIYIHSSLADRKVSQPPPQEPGPIADIPASVPPIGVPFLSQVGSAGVEGSGSNNCGPASVAMTIRYFGGSITVEDAAIAIRGSNTAKNKGTNFKGSSTIQLLTKPEYGLATSDVSTFDDMRKQISEKHPVIILINNTVYRYNPGPYVNDSDGWFVNNHILVVTGYDTEYVYVNDPLRYESESIAQPENYKIPVEKFKDAASTTPQSTETKWFAISVSKKTN